MNIKKLATDIATAIVIAFVTSVLVTFCYNLIVHSAGVVEWDTSVRTGIMLGIVVPLVSRRK